MFLWSSARLASKLTPLHIQRILGGVVFFVQFFYLFIRCFYFFFVFVILIFKNTPKLPEVQGVCVRACYQNNVPQSPKMPGVCGG